MIKFFLKKKKIILKTIAIKYNIEIQASPRLLNNLSIIHVCIKIYIHKIATRVTDYLTFFFLS